jgi:hypothetical protein
MVTVPESTIDEERLNRRLKREIATMQKDQFQLLDSIRHLEERNMQLICGSVQIDWNLMYQDDELPEDYWPEERIQKWDIISSNNLENNLPPLDPKRSDKYKLIDVSLTENTPLKIINLETNRKEKQIIMSGMMLNGKEIKLLHGYNESCGQKYYQLVYPSKTP